MTPGRVVATRSVYATNRVQTTGGGQSGRLLSRCRAPSMPAETPAVVIHLSAIDEAPARLHLRVWELRLIRRRGVYQVVASTPARRPAPPAMSAPALTVRTSRIRWRSA